MNWGLFLALVGFLLPLAQGLRLGAAMMLAGMPLTRPVQAMRIMLILLLAVPISGKAPALLYALTGELGSISQLTETFMLTPWGFAHAALMVIAVIGIDLALPVVVAALDKVAPPGRPLQRRYLARDAAIAVLLLMLAWAAAQ